MSSILNQGEIEWYNMQNMPMQRRVNYPFLITVLKWCVVQPTGRSPYLPPGHHDSIFLTTCRGWKGSSGWPGKETWSGSDSNMYKFFGQLFGRCVVGEVRGQKGRWIRKLPREWGLSERSYLSKWCHRPITHLKSMGQRKAAAAQGHRSRSLQLFTG